MTKTYNLIREEVKAYSVRYVEPWGSAFRRGIFIAREELPYPPPQKLKVTVEFD